MSQGLFFNAPNLTPVFVEKDREVGHEDMCGELMVSMYGTRPAASNWQKCYSELFMKHGLKRSMENCFIFRHDEKDLDVMVHGDDFITFGDQDDLKCLRDIGE